MIPVPSPLATTLRQFSPETIAEMAEIRAANDLKYPRCVWCREWIFGSDARVEIGHGLLHDGPCFGEFVAQEEIAAVRWTDEEGTRTKIVGQPAQDYAYSEEL